MTSATAQHGMNHASPLTIAECAEHWRDAERARNRSELLRWDCAPTALASSGTSRAQQMADALGVDVTTVHNLAKAQMLYLYLYEWNAQKAILARAIYSYIRFEAVWRKHFRYEIAPSVCLEFLNSNLSNDGMEAQMENIFNPAPEWMRRLGNKQARSWLAKIATEPDKDQPAKITRCAAVLNRWIEEAG